MVSILELIEDFISTPVEDVSDYSKRYISKVKQIETSERVINEIYDGLVKLTSNPDYRTAALWLDAAYIHVSSRYLKPLCQILEMDIHYIPHESIVEILYVLKDEDSIPSLRKALSYEPISDPSDELGVKILHTLSKINTSEAISVIEEATQSRSDRIQEEAKRLLSRRQ